MNKRVVKKGIYLITGLIISSLAFNMFLLPANITAYGISGLSVVMNHMWDINPTIFISLCTVFLVLISYFFLGKKSTRKTIIGALLYPFFVFITLPIAKLINFGNSEIDLFVMVIFGAVFTGVGKGMIYKQGFNTCETDVFCGLLVKYFHITMGSSILIIDGIIVFIGGLVFGAERMVYSLIALVIISKLSNKIMFGLNNSKTFYIVSKQSKKIKAYIKENLKQGATIFEATGKNEKNKNVVIMTATNNEDYKILKSKILEIDPHAFVSILNSYEVANEYLRTDKKSI